MKIKYLGVILCIIILFIGFSGGCVTATKSPEVLDIKEQPADDFSSLQRNYSILQDENQYLHKLATAAVKIILEEEATEDQLISLAQTQWEYDIRIYEVSKDGVILDNGKSLNSLEIVEVNKNFIIALGESWSLLEILPSHIHQLGSLKDSYVDHMQIISPVAYDIIRTDGGTVHGEQYVFKAVPAGTEIKLVLTLELQTRIDHPSGTIIIKVR